MGVSKVDLCNIALGHLGKGGIAALTEDSEAARKCSLFLPIAANSALSRSTWTFQRKIAALASVTNDWEERWDYKYDEPNDLAAMVRLIPKVDPNENGNPLAYQRLNGAIYTNEADAKAMYVYEFTTPEAWPDIFVQAVAYLLARDLVMPITRNRRLWPDLNTAYEGVLSQAVMIDAAGEPTEYAYPSQYLEDRDAEARFRGNASYDGSSFWSS